MSAFAKYALTPDALNVHGRIATLYEAGTSGKGVLINQLMAGGMILKECGLLEIINMLDQHPAYLAATPSGRRAILINELIAMGGIHQQAASDAVTHQEAAPVVAPSPAPQVAAAPATDTETPQKPNLPHLGR